MKYGEIPGHFSHLHCILQLQQTKQLYTCNGCMEHGFGFTYRCEGCKYDLHRECTVDRPYTIISHPFFPGCKFEFLESPPGERVCDACGRDVKRFVYHCREKGWDLHPCCAKLDRVIRTQEHVQLHLRKTVDKKCSRCGVKKFNKKGVNGWSYVSTCNRFHFHVACIKDIMVEVCQKFHFEDNVDGEIMDSGRKLMIPSRELVRYDGGGGGGNFSKYIRIAKVVIKCLVSIFLGDPVGMVVGLVAAVLERG